MRPRARSRSRRAPRSAPSSARAATSHGTCAARSGRSGLRGASCRSRVARAHAPPPAGARADDRLDDPAFVELLAGNLLDDPPTGHHDDAVTEPGELERVARLDDDGDAFPRLGA